MIGCLWTRVHKQPIIALYFEFEIVLKFFLASGPVVNQISIKHFGISNFHMPFESVMDSSMYIASFLFMLSVSFCIR